MTRAPTMNPRHTCRACGSGGQFVRESTYVAKLSGNCFRRRTYRCPTTDCACSGWTTTIERVYPTDTTAKEADDAPSD